MVVAVLFVLVVAVDRLMASERWPQLAPARRVWRRWASRRFMSSVLAAQVERWVGTARTVLVFFVGAVGARLLTALGPGAVLRFGLVESSVVNKTDASSVAARREVLVVGRPAPAAAPLPARRGEGGDQDAAGRGHAGSRG